MRRREPPIAPSGVHQPTNASFGSLACLSVNDLDAGWSMIQM